MSSPSSLTRALGCTVVALTCFSRPAISGEAALPDKILASNVPPAPVSLTQLQDQLQATQLALERSRVEAEAATARNSEFLMSRLESIERSLTSERGRDLELLQSFQRTMLILAAAAAAIGLLALLGMAYFQWQSVNHLAEITAALPRSLALGSVRAIASLPFSEPPLALGPGELSTLQLRETIAKLEKRVQELELTGHSPVGEGNEVAPMANARSAGSKPAESSQSREAARSEVLAGKGQSFLSLNQPAEALACFDEALAVAPGRAEILVKRGNALEQLGRLEEAIQSYDRAIAADNSMTLAYLYKGALFNRMQRFIEALECYERALRHQAKRTS